MAKWIAVVMVFVMGAVILVPIFQASEAAKLNTSRAMNLKSLLRATWMYAEEHGDSFPPSSSWASAIRPYLQDKSLRDGYVEGSFECRYSFRNELGGRKTASVDSNQWVVKEDSTGNKGFYLINLGKRITWQRQAE